MRMNYFQDSTEQVFEKRILIHVVREPTWRRNGSQS